MDISNTNTENYNRLWSPIRDEYDAKADELPTERRMKYYDAFEDLDEEVYSVGDWTEASWDQFKAKTNRAWQEFATDGE